MAHNGSGAGEEAKSALTAVAWMEDNASKAERNEKWEWSTMEGNTL
jgi:hypothetical protein